MPLLSLLYFWFDLHEIAIANLIVIYNVPCEPWINLFPLFNIRKNFVLIFLNSNLGMEILGMLWKIVEIRVFKLYTSAD